jgi:hypothetical protein
MKTSRLSRSPGVLRAIALLLLLAAPSLAQNGGAGGDPLPSGECMPSREPHQCAARCPSFDTCLVAGDEQLYYQVDERRFDCVGFDCRAANESLSDYCCQTGEFAPPSPDEDEDDGGGGCTLTSSKDNLGIVAGLWAGLLGLALRRRRLRQSLQEQREL